ncbi:MAG: TonB-dependent receptor [Xanthomonadales bacterium]|nr:TonB-dependent receptor [Xanthomonadales bacterium]
MTSSKNAKKKALWRISPLPFAIALALSVAPVWAQDEDAAEDAAEEVIEVAEEKAADLGRIEVTGSLIKRADFTSTSPVQIINAEAMARVGQLEIADILQGNTIAAGSTQLNNQFSGFVIQGGTGVQTLNLRGLGSSRTLVLLNGGRVGGSGTRGQVQALDLAILPEIAVQRVELLLDGSSSIYGSDAIAGVANIITRRQVDGFEFNALTELPEGGGGELVRAALITGWNSDKGSATLSAQWQYREALTIGDRDFLSCSQPLFRDAAGNLIDREDRSITAGTAISGCTDLYNNTVIDGFTGDRYIPSPDGVTIGPFPGYRPRQNGRYDDPGGVAFYEDVFTETFTRAASVINQQERFNVYATFDYAFDFLGGVDWSADVLYSNRKTSTVGFRQFFPWVGSSQFRPYADDPDYNPGLAVSRPVMPYPSNTDVEVDFFYVTSGLQGLLPTDSYWSWQLNASYSRSDGSYTRNSILRSRSADVFDGGGANAPRVNYFDPAILSGANMAALVRAVGVNQTGNTVYDEFLTNAIITGDLFELPAGTVGVAGGLEYRTFSIDDQPSQESREGDLWGESSALVTKGTNTVKEAFVELEIPLLAGLPGIEELTLNVSARTFDYDVGGSDSVWKAGLGWRVVPSFLARATVGTSYRAPALFELFLGDQTGFVGQAGIDPCINWGDSVNDNIRANCAAAGIPDDYQGVGASATVVSGGGAANLNSETSDAFTFGLVWTPEFTDLSIAVDYIDITVNDQIAQLGAGAIVSGCYGGENFPNAFCGLLDREPANALSPFIITEVRDSYLNVNEQIYRGIDLNVVWNKDLDFGQLEVAIQSTWNLENVRRLFDPGEVEGFETIDSVGTIGSPENVTNFRTSFNWQDWIFNYAIQYIAETDNSPFVDEETTYFGFEPAFRDITMERAFFQTISVMYQQTDWDVLVGINNLFDEEPDTVSGGVAARRGNVPVAATQYDYLGRRLFVRFNYRWQ